VGGTTTSSNGGTVASQLQVFALGGSSTQSPTFTIAYHPPLKPHRVLASAKKPVTPAAHASRAAVKAVGSARITTPQGMTIKAWDANTSNTQDVQGRLVLNGKPVAGVTVGVQGWTSAPTDANGTFTYPVDVTMVDRHIVKVANADHATI